MHSKTIAILSIAILFALAPAASAQAPPQPGPEHKIMQDEAGTWDAVVSMALPDGSTSTSKGVQVDTLGCGGMCLITDFKSEMMGMPFVGHGLTTWDPMKKKYVGSWADSMTPVLATTEGTYDAAAKAMTSWMETRDMNGNVAKMKSVSEYQDADHKTMTMFMTGPDGKDVQGLKISYTRRK